MILPVAQRELRVATRRKSTYRLRVGSALVALLIGGGAMLLQGLAGGTPATLGVTLFGILTWMGFAACIASGPFFTSDCLSEEKREGTLGFLFLTDLRGYDVVAGKLVATSFRAVSCLLAIFPVLATTLLMGSVSGSQFTRASLSLLMALVCSLCAGLLISSISKHSQRALWGTVLVMLSLLAAGPLLGAILFKATSRLEFQWLAMTSPGYTFVSAGNPQSRFWTSLGVISLLAVAMFGLASFLVRRTWQDRLKTASKLARRRGVLNASEQVRGRRGRLLDANPVLWLVLREKWQDAGPWGLAIAGAAGFGIMAVYAPEIMWMAWNSICGFLVLVLYVWTAAQAPRMFVDARQSGLLDLILTTPLSVREIVRGHWLALLRILRWPALLLVLAQAAGTTLAYQEFWIPIYQQSGQGRGGGSSPYILGLSAGLAALAGTATLANLAAISWFGMWMGFTSKTVLQAALKTLVFVQVVPALALGFASGMVTMLLLMPGIIRGGGAPAAPGLSMLATPLLMAIVQAVLSILKDLGFIWWARKRLCERLRPELLPATAVSSQGLPPIIPQRA